MPDGDWTLAPYARVFGTLADDYPEVWESDALLAWYVRLLVPADRAWPVALMWPRNIPTEVMVALCEEGAVDRLAGDRYQVSGMERLQRQTSERWSAGGRARAATAIRGPRGRWTPNAGPDAGPLNGNAGPDAGRSLVTDAGGQSLVTSAPATRRNVDSPGDPLPTVGGHQDSPMEPIARAPAREAGPVDPIARVEADYLRNVREHGPDTAPCDAPDLHRLVHTYAPGVGWRCVTCERADTRTFRERMESHGGPHF